MGLDWFTVVAQVVNFLVLIWLLKHFLYGRIVHAMNEREARIAGRLKDAARQRASAEQEAEVLRKKNRELDARRDQLLTRASEEADEYRRQLLDEARRETEAAQHEWRLALQRERQEILQDFRERLGQQAFAVARRGLRELANADLEEQILSVFLERLQTLEPTEQQAIAAAAQDPRREIEIRTGFPLSDATRERLTQSLREQWGDHLHVRFNTASELICGLELRFDSHRFVWNLDSYLEGLEASFFAALDESITKHVNPR